MMEWIARLAHGWLRPFGLDLKRSNALVDQNIRRRKIMDHAGIAQVIDVGANRGQYAHRLRQDGYRGRILSLEPATAAFSILARAAQDDPLWEVRRVGLGPTSKTDCEMNITLNSVSSSMLAQTARMAAIEGSGIAGTETVTMVTLDEVAPSVIRDEVPALLKLDVQGAEGMVLAGGIQAVPRFHLVEMELALVPLYEEQSSLVELLQVMDGFGFDLVSIAPNTIEGLSSHLLEVDGVFARR